MQTLEDGYVPTSETYDKLTLVKNYGKDLIRLLRKLKGASDSQ